MTGQQGAPLDAIRLEVLWSRLAAIADEAATALLRTAFSTIIREANDYTVVLMNRAGQTIAECRAAIPAFAVLMGVLTRHLLDRFPAGTWRKGDVVITNDQWLATGHLPDIAMVTQIFRRGGLAGSPARPPTSRTSDLMRRRPGLRLAVDGQHDLIIDIDYGGGEGTAR